VTNKAKNKTSNSDAFIGTILPSFFAEYKTQLAFLFIFSFALYANTLLNDYTQDDAIVITDNMYTQAGIKGWGGIFTKDTFYGFFKEEGKANLVQGGRYRPFTLAMFALENQLFGNWPFIGHFINVLLFALSVLLLCHLTFTLLRDSQYRRWAQAIAFFTALIFAAHPIHTEVVANIKGRDEIMSLAASLLAMVFVLKNVDERQAKYLLFAGLSFFVALLSKENAIAFLAITPLAIYIFKNISFSKIIQSTSPLLFATLLFLTIRFSILGFGLGGDPPLELMNNPFLKIEGNAYVPLESNERIATIAYSLGKYIQLLIFPHPLTHDYYPRQIAIQHLGAWQVILSIIMYLFLIGLSIYGTIKKNIWGFAAAFYLGSLFLVSNIPFSIGTNLSERFVYMPSIGYCIIIAYLFCLLFDKLKGKKVVAWMLPSLLIILFTVKTFTRNFVWKDNYTLFTTDVKVSGNSAKMLNSAAGVLLETHFGDKEHADRDSKIRQALDYLTKAIKIHPNYKLAHLQKGNAHYYLKEFEEAIQSYNNVLRIDPDYPIQENIAIANREAGKYFGEEKGDLFKSINYLQKALSYNTNDYETLRLLGVAYGVKQDHPKALEYLQKALALKPKDPDALLNLATAMFMNGRHEEAEKLRQEALKIDPNVQKKRQNIK